MDYFQKALELHKKYKGKLEVKSKIEVSTKDDLSTAYSPGVAQPCLEINKNREDAYIYTNKGNAVAVVSNGTAVLGLGNIGAQASMPVMEGKCILFKNFANVDAYPILVDSEEADDVVKAVKLIAPGFGGINLEDISAPSCFEIEKRLKQELDIPVFHDDQHGSGIVVLSGLINSLKLAGKKIEDCKIVFNGAGAAGMATSRLLVRMGARNVIIVDTKGAIYKGRDNLNGAKRDISLMTNPNSEKGSIHDIINGADIFIGLSKGNLLTAEDIRKMNSKAIVFALANPVPEISPEEAKKGGAFIVATGRSDFPNQINNVSAFPGVFRGALDVRAKDINDKMNIAAARALAAYVKSPTTESIVASPLDKNTAKVVAEAVSKAARESGVARV
ncbi:NAD-dependent malic enzyme [Candidatus Woesearchaeota archaeon]|nr:NAD-dependent malic enzyme [Candidatus Woesearchaeota archaeon]